MHTGNRKKFILVLGEDPTQGLHDTTITQLQKKINTLLILQDQKENFV